ncbi:MAG: acetate--CoA ligase family protein, partial [Marinilabiliaceae bacterium]|nr:acetate--CoA ligase family protein [Marinilabiliaceae bacterium]
RTILCEDEATELLKAYGFPTLKGKVVHSSEEAAQTQESFSRPVVMKIVSPDILHKTEVEGLMLSVNTPGEAALAYDRILQNIAEKRPDAVVKGVLMVPFIPNGEEVILGMKRDPSFGPVLMFGMGGTLVELYQDVSFRVVPVSPEQAQSMMEEIKGYPLLNGYRGREVKDIDAVKTCLLRLSQLVMDYPAIEELDVNPLIVNEAGCFVADVKIKLSNEY